MAGILITLSRTNKLIVNESGGYLMSNIEKILISSGWMPSRCINIDSYMEWFISEGYSPTESIKRFLQEFGGLTISIPCKKRFDQGTATRKIIIDPEENGFEYEFIHKYNSYFKEQLFPIGTSESTIDYFMDTNGAIYAIFGDVGAKWGNSIYEVISRISNGDLLKFVSLY